MHQTETGCREIAEGRLAFPIDALSAEPAQNLFLPLC